jgi:hypothetical protein
VLGREPDERDIACRRQVAVLLDDSDFFAELSPRQHLELLARSFGRDVDPDRWLAEAGQAEQRDVHAYHLSAGQRRRLLLGLALLGGHGWSATVLLTIPLVAACAVRTVATQLRQPGPDRHPDRRDAGAADLPDHPRPGPRRARPDLRPGHPRPRRRGLVALAVLLCVLH